MCRNSWNYLESSFKISRKEIKLSLENSISLSKILNFKMTVSKNCLQLMNFKAIKSKYAPKNHQTAVHLKSSDISLIIH